MSIYFNKPGEKHFLSSRGFFFSLQGICLINRKMHALEHNVNINFERDIVMICCYWGGRTESESEGPVFLAVILLP